MNVCKLSYPFQSGGRIFQTLRRWTCQHFGFVTSQTQRRQFSLASTKERRHFVDHGDCKGRNRMLHRCSFQMNHVRRFSNGLQENEITGDDSDAVVHIPVLKDEVLDILNPQENQVFIDMTFGAGGHTKALLEYCPGSKVLALDRDPLAFTIAQDLQKQFGDRLVPLEGRFSEIRSLLDDIGLKENSLDGALFDCGTSSMQFETTERGFSLVRDGPLDMRMDWNRDPSKPTAADVVNHLSEDGLYEILKKYGEEKLARHVAKAIVDSRYTYGKFKTTKQLADVVQSVFTGSHRRDKLMRHAHVATKTFQALRIFVNDELNELHNGLELVHKFLKPGTGKCVAISFHSLEDRIIKRQFHGIDIDAKASMSLNDHLRTSSVSHSLDDVTKIMANKWTPVSKKIICATEEEVARNPRARSAKLRAAIKSPS